MTGVPWAGRTRAPPLTPEQHDEVARLKAEGLGAKTIGVMIGATMPQVYYSYYKMRTKVARGKMPYRPQKQDPSPRNPVYDPARDGEHEPPATVTAAQFGDPSPGRRRIQEQLQR